jgi:predicted  nucleic acid-binding Zn-ribbon protein
VAGRTIEQRVDRLERVVQIIAEDQVSLQKLIAELATETRRGFDRVAKQFEESERRMREMDKKMDERFRETDERMRKTDERMRQTDERIDKLVSAMGEYIRRSPRA